MQQPSKFAKLRANRALLDLAAGYWGHVAEINAYKLRDAERKEKLRLSAPARAEKARATRAAKVAERSIAYEKQRAFAEQLAERTAREAEYERTSVKIAGDNYIEIVNAKDCSDCCFAPKSERCWRIIAPAAREKFGRACNEPGIAYAKLTVNADVKKPAQVAG